MLLRGLPGSGKSTFAKEVIEASKAGRTPVKWKRINKDIMREMLDMDDWSPENEYYLNRCVSKIAELYLSNGYNVISDNMNFRIDHVKDAIKIANRINEVSDKYFVTVGVRDFDTDIEECIIRDSKRPKPVGEEVIRKIYNQYMQNGFPDVSRLIGAKDE